MGIVEGDASREEGEEAEHEEVAGSAGVRGDAEDDTITQQQVSHQRVGSRPSGNGWMVVCGSVYQRT